MLFLWVRFHSSPESPPLPHNAALLYDEPMTKLRIPRQILLVLLGVTAFASYAQNVPPAQPVPIESGGEIQREGEAFRRLPTTGSIKERLAACQAFVDQFPGSQLSLRVMRDVCTFYLLQEKTGNSDPLRSCAAWIGERLSSPAYSWNRFAGAPESLILERIETQLVYARILANLRSDSGKGRYDEALSALAEILVEGDSRPDLWSARPDLKEQIDFARCWCFHGQQEELRSALSCYQHFMETYPSSDFMPAVLLNAARTLNAIDPQGSREQTILYLTRLRDEFPKSAEAAAPDVLKLLGER